MMRVVQHFTDSNLRNFSYFVIGEQGNAFIFDPWDGQECLDIVQKEGALVKGVINTHEHWDHTRGNELIVKKTQCPVYAHPRAQGKVAEADVFLEDGDFIQVDSQTKLIAVDTPGHTMAHLCLLLEHQGRIEAIFTGDTLFNAGVGNCHNGGDPETLFETIEKKFRPLEDHIKIYPGHEYLGNNLGFTLNYEPQNDEATQWLQKYKEIDWKNSPVTTTIKDEKEINLFFRLESEDLKESLSQNGEGKFSNRKEVFLTLRQLRNKW